MTEAEVAGYRQSLTSLRRRLDGDVSHLADEALNGRQHGDGGDSRMPTHMADIGSDAFEQDFTLSLLANERQVLDEISAALDRLDTGRFGACEECSGSIPKSRLNALPYTRYCVSCARKLEEGT